MSPYPGKLVIFETVADRQAQLLVETQNATGLNFDPLVDRIALKDNGAQKRALEIVHHEEGHKTKTPMDLKDLFALIGTKMNWTWLKH